MKLRTTTLTAIAAATIVLTGCGESKSDRALSGAGIGAGVGAVGSTIMGGDPLTGAVVGGVVGGATGALTNKNDINFGRPAWR